MRDAKQPAFRILQMAGLRERPRSPWPSRPARHPRRRRSSRACARNSDAGAAASPIINCPKASGVITVSAIDHLLCPWSCPSGQDATPTAKDSVTQKYLSNVRDRILRHGPQRPSGIGARIPRRAMSREISTMPRVTHGALYDQAGPRRRERGPVAGGLYRAAREKARPASPMALFKDRRRRQLRPRLH